MREPGIEPGPTPWQGAILPLDHSRDWSAARGVGGGKEEKSAVVQWLGYLAFTQETRVQTPAAEPLFARRAGLQPWSSGMMEPSQGFDPGSIPGGCICEHVHMAGVV